MIGKILQGLWFVFVTSIVGIAIRQGVVTMTWKIDGYGISWVIIVMFLLSLSMAMLYAAGVKWINLEHVRHLANDQAYWGVFGTIVGVFLAMLSLKSSTSEEVLAAIPGILLAFWTSILGMAGGWVTIKTYQFLGGKNNE